MRTDNDGNLHAPRQFGASGSAGYVSEERCAHLFRHALALIKAHLQILSRWGCAQVWIWSERDRTAPKKLGTPEP
jgi:hypothetical protein